MANVASLPPAEDVLFPSSAFFSEPFQTIIVFDWDDTLFPTSWMDSSDIDIQRPPSDEEQQSKFKAVEEAAKAVIEKAMDLSSKTVIITNATCPWVTDSCRIFMPGLLPYFEGPEATIPVMYARNVLTDAPPSKRWMTRVGVDPRFPDRSLGEEEKAALYTLAKELCMRKVVKSFYTQYPGQSWKNLISIGDSQQEHYALQEVSFQHSQPCEKVVRTKTLLMRSKPSPVELEAQLRAVLRHLEGVVRHDGDLEVSVIGEGPLSPLGEALSPRSPTSPLSPMSPTAKSVELIVGQ